jgi:3-oxoacyl-[acyl-carrier protein] reductase
MPARKRSASAWQRGCHGRRLNVNEAGSIEALVDAVSTEFGGISILVNNAGITRDNLLMRMKDEDLAGHDRHQPDSRLPLSKAVMRGMMKARKGRIINIASVIGVTGNAGQANYAAAKAGIIAFSKSLAKEIGSRGITVNVVAPGFIDTDMTAPAGGRSGGDARPDRARAARRTGRHRPRGGLPRRPGATYITGETLHVNGGMYMP